MATKKDTGRYVVIRDFADHVAGDVIDLDADQAAELIRDGMVAAKEG